MDQHYPISSFEKVYLIDLCEPLLQVARKRFAKRGWNNVVVLCQDASEFSLPEWGHGVDPKGSVGFITMSYSLSMVGTLFTGTFPTRIAANESLYCHRFPASMRCWTALTMFLPRWTVSWAWSTSTLQVVSHLYMKKPSVERARNAVGLVGGSGRSGLTSTMSHSLHTAVITWSTSLEP